MQFSCRLFIIAFGLFLSIATTIALNENSKAECKVHPDPHMVSWHSIPFDFQHGCDVVLVDNANLKIHLRLVKYLMTPSTQFSYIEAVGVKFANNDVFEARVNNYYINDAFLASANDPALGAVVTSIGGYPFSIGTGTIGYQYRFGLDPNPTNYFIAIDDWGIGGKGGMGIRIVGHGSFFIDSTGMCGWWNADTGLHDRDYNNMIPGLPPLGLGYDASPYGIEWQVGVDPADDAFLSNVDLPTGGHSLTVGGCVARRRDLLEDETNNSRGLTECVFCDNLKNPLAAQFCNYDANVLGCDFAKYLPVYQPDVKDYYTAIMKPQDCKSKLSTDVIGKKTNCEKKGGRCVLYCDTKSKKFDCLLGLCKNAKYDEKGKPVLLDGRYYNSCACMRKKK